jgi:N-dimethylarginine dimethylaminohydrolase
MPQPSFFMCRPTYYGINYKINAWMDLRRQADRSLALKQWFALRTTLENYLGAKIHCCAA